MDEYALIPEKAKPSKTALVLLSTPPIGMLGLDRIYMGCFRSGLLKFLMLLTSLILLVSGSGLFVSIGLYMLLFYFMWALTDWARVQINALSRSYFQVFCNSTTTWGGQNDIRWAFWFSLLLNSFNLFLLLFIVIAFFLGGFEYVWDSMVSTTKTEKYVPDAKAMKKYLAFEKK